MKKTVIAALIAASATSAIAGEIYSTETSKISMKGEVDAYVAKTDILDDSKDVEVNVWAKVQMDAEQKLTDNLTSFASFEIESGSWYTGTDTDARFDDVHVGIKTDSWGIAVGEVGDLAESLDAIQKDDITNEGNYYGSTAGNNRESDGKGVVGKLSVADFTFVADAQTESNRDIDATIGFSADYANDLFSVGASYVTGDTNETASADASDYEVYGISASTQFGGLYLAATYAEFEGVNSFGFYNAGEYQSGNTMGVAASYSFTNTRVYTTYSLAELDEETKSGLSTNDDVKNFVFGVDYAIASNITTFAEYQFGEADFAEDSETFVAGVYYSF